jgi:hypothetical protein
MSRRHSRSGSVRSERSNSILGGLSSLTVDDIEREKERAKLLSSGHAIPNVELERSINKAQETIARVELAGNLTPEGHRIAEDTKRLLVASEHLLRDKNKDEELQKIQENLRVLAKKSSEVTRAQREEKGDRVESASGLEQSEIQRATSDIRFIVDAVISSGSLRKVLRKANRLLLESLSSDSDQGEAGQVPSMQPQQQTSPAVGIGPQPTPFQQPQVPQPVTASHTHHVDSRTVVLGGDPRFSIRYVDNPIPQPVATPVAPTPMPMPVPQPVMAPQQQAPPIQGTGRNTPHTRSNYKVVLRGKEMNFLTKSISDQRVREIAEEVQDLVIDISNDHSLQASISRLLDMYNRIFASTSNRFSKYSTLRDDPEFIRSQKEARVEARRLLENFAGGYKLKELQRLMWKFKDETQHDRQMRHHFKHLREFLTRSINEPDFAQNEGWVSELVHHIQSSRRDLQSHRQTLFRIVQDLDMFVTNLREDRVLSEFTGSARKLSKDIFYDEQGNMKLKPSSLNELIKILVPVFRDQFLYFAIPEFHGGDATMKYTVSQLVIRAPDLFPTEIALENSNHVRMDLSDLVEASRGYERFNAAANLHLTIRGIHLLAEDVHVKYQRLSFPKISDEGTLNMEIPRGINLDILLSGDALDDRLFHVDDVDCHVGAVRLYGIDFEKHEFLFKLFKGTIQRQIRTSIKRQIESKLTDLLVSMDAKGRSGWKAVATRFSRNKYSSTPRPRNRSDSTDSTISEMT